MSTDRLRLTTLGFGEFIRELVGLRSFMTDMKGQSASRSKSDDIYFSDRPNVQSGNLSLHFPQCEVEWMWPLDQKEGENAGCSSCFFVWPWANHFMLLSLSMYVDPDLKVRKPMGASQAWCENLVVEHISEGYRTGPRRKVDTWQFHKHVKLKAIIFRKVVYSCFPVYQ